MQNANIIQHSDFEGVVNLSHDQDASVVCYDDMEEDENEQDDVHVEDEVDVEDNEEEKEQEIENEEEDIDQEDIEMKKTNTTSNI